VCPLVPFIYHCHRVASLVRSDLSRRARVCAHLSHSLALATRLLLLSNEICLDLCLSIGQSIHQSTSQALTHICLCNHLYNGISWTSSLAHSRHSRHFLLSLARSPFPSIHSLTSLAFVTFSRYLLTVHSLYSLVLNSLLTRSLHKHALIPSFLPYLVFPPTTNVLHLLALFHQSLSLPTVFACTFHPHTLTRYNSSVQEIVIMAQLMKDKAAEAGLPASYEPLMWPSEMGYNLQLKSAAGSGWTMIHAALVAHQLVHMRSHPVSQWVKKSFYFAAYDGCCVESDGYFGL
jgi:hypothetical protein